MANKIDDFGQKIGGARKDVQDILKTRSINVSDTTEWSDVEREQFITKKQVWKEPDYQQMVDDGVPRSVVYFIKNLRDSLPAKPYSTSDTYQYGYIEYVADIRDHAMQLRSEEDVSSFFGDVLLGHYCKQTGYKRYAELPDAYNCMTTKVLRAATLTGSSLEYAVEKKQFLYTDTERIRAAYRVRQYTGDNVTFENPYGRNYFLYTNEYGSRSYLYPSSSESEQFSGIDDWEAGTYFLVEGSSHLVAFNFESEEAAYQYALEHEKKTEKKSKQHKKKFVPDALESVERQGDDYRGDANISGENMMEVFGFRGGEFGNWESQNDRQFNLNYAYDAFMDLAAALDIEPTDVSLGGNLSIAFGSRGHGSALAHYEPARNVINLTKMKGAGSLAHEWGHAFDYFVAHALDLGYTYATSSQRLGEIRRAMKFKPSGGYTKYYEESLEQDRNYSRDSMGYWSSNIEMFARAFACYVSDKLAEKGIRSDYLCGHAESSIFPSGEERALINQAFDKLITELKEENILTAAVHQETVAEEEAVEEENTPVQEAEAQPETEIVSDIMLLKKDDVIEFGGDIVVITDVIENELHFRAFDTTTMTESLSTVGFITLNELARQGYELVGFAPTMRAEQLEAQKASDSKVDIYINSENTAPTPVSDDTVPESSTSTKKDGETMVNSEVTAIGDYSKLGAAKLEDIGSNEKSYMDFLKFSGRIFKHPVSVALEFYAQNPQANYQFIAAEPAWASLGYHLKPSCTGLRFRDRIGNVTTLYDFGDIVESTQPPVWTVNTANEPDIKKALMIPQESSLLQGLMNLTIREDAILSCMDKLNLDLTEEQQREFILSFDNAVAQIIAGRLELGGNKFDIPADNRAFQMLETNEQRFTLLSYTGQAAKNALRTIESAVKELEVTHSIERKEKHESEQANGLQDMVDAQQRAESESAKRESSGDSEQSSSERSDLSENGEGQRDSGMENRSDNREGNESDVASGNRSNGNQAEQRGNSDDVQETESSERDIRNSGGGTGEVDGGGANRESGTNLDEVHGGELSGESGMDAPATQLSDGSTVSGTESNRVSGTTGGTVPSAASSSNGELSGYSRVGGGEEPPAGTHRNDGASNDSLNDSINAAFASTENTSIDTSFAEQVDATIANEATSDDLKVCDTPQILLDCGCRQLPMLYTKAHLMDAMHEKSEMNPHYHGLSADEIKAVPQLLEHPAIVLDSVSNGLNGNSSILLVLNAVDQNNAPILVSVKPNGLGKYHMEQVDANFITSIYGKEGNFTELIEKAVSMDNILYWNRQLCENLHDVAKVDFPASLLTVESDKILHESRNKDNGFGQKFTIPDDINGQQPISSEARAKILFDFAEKHGLQGEVFVRKNRATDSGEGREYNLVIKVGKRFELCENLFSLAHHEYFSEKKLRESLEAFEQTKVFKDYLEQKALQERIQNNEVRIGDRFLFHNRECEVTGLNGLYADEVVVTSQDKTSNGMKYAVTQNVDKKQLLHEGTYLGNSADMDNEPAELTDAERKVQEFLEHDLNQICLPIAQDEKEDYSEVLFDERTASRYSEMEYPPVSKDFIAVAKQFQSGKIDYAALGKTLAFSDGTTVTIDNTEHFLNVYKDDAGVHFTEGNAHRLVSWEELGKMQLQEIYAAYTEILTNDTKEFPSSEPESNKKIQNAAVMMNKVGALEPSESASIVSGDTPDSSLVFSNVLSTIHVRNVSADGEVSDQDIATIKENGAIKYLSDSISDSDRSLIEERAKQVRQVALDNWNALDDMKKYDAILATADKLQYAQIMHDNNNIAGRIAKYTASIIFEEEPFPTTPDDAIRAWDNKERIYLDESSNTYSWVYFNPDSSAGGQMVINTFDVSLLKKAMLENDPHNIIESECTQYLCDITAPDFVETVSHYLNTYPEWTFNVNDVPSMMNALETMHNAVNSRIDVPQYGLSIDLANEGSIELISNQTEYLGGLDENGHERRDNFADSSKTKTFYVENEFLFEWDEQYGSLIASHSYIETMVAHQLELAANDNDYSLVIVHKDGSREAFVPKVDTYINSEPESSNNNQTVQDLPQTPFTHINEEVREFWTTSQWENPEPDQTDSPWGVVKHFREWGNGIYEVDTVSNNGMMIPERLAEQILTPECLEIATHHENGFYCFKEDGDMWVATLELLDKGLVEKQADWHHNIYDAIAQTVQIYHPSYWQAREASFTQPAENTTSQEEIAKDILITLDFETGDKYYFKASGMTLDEFMTAFAEYEKPFEAMRILGASTTEPMIAEMEQTKDVYSLTVLVQSQTIRIDDYTNGELTTSTVPLPEKMLPQPEIEQTETELVPIPDILKQELDTLTADIMLRGTDAILSAAKELSEKKEIVSQIQDASLDITTEQLSALNAQDNLLNTLYQRMQSSNASAVDTLNAFAEELAPKPQEVTQTAVIPEIPTYLKHYTDSVEKFMSNYDIDNYRGRFTEGMSYGTTLAIELLSNQSKQQTYEYLRDMFQEVLIANQDQPKTEKEQQAASLLRRLDKVMDADGFIHKFSERLGIDELAFHDFYEMDVPKEIPDTFGAFSTLCETVNIQKAKEYFDSMTGQDLKMRQVYPKLHNLMREFIVTDGFDIDTIQPEPQKVTTAPIPLYKDSFLTAKENNEVDQYRASIRATNECRADIATLSSECYNNSVYDSAAVMKGLLEKYVPERIEMILAVTVHDEDWDARYTQDVRSWAEDTLQRLDMKNLPTNSGELHPNVHPGLLNLLAKQAMQPQPVPKAEKTKSETPMFVPQSVVDNVLRLGGVTHNSVEHIIAFYAKEKTTSENAEFLKKEFGTNGRGVFENDKRYAAWFDENGITICEGNTAFGTKSSLITWEQAAERISALLDEKQYAAKDTLKNAPDVELSELAEKMYFTYRDADHDNEARVPLFASSYADSTRLVINSLKTASLFEETVKTLKQTFANNESICNALDDLRLPQRQFTASPDYSVAVEQFITEDEKKHLLSNPVNKGSYDNFYASEHSKDEKIDFLKTYHGIGGYCGHGYSISYDGKGMDIERTENSGARNAKVHMTWSEVTKIIDSMMESRISEIQSNRVSIAEKNAEIADTIEVGDYVTLQGMTYEVTKINGDFMMNMNRLNADGTPFEDIGTAGHTFIGNWKSTLVEEAGDSLITVDKHSRTYEIYQMKSGDKYHYARFESLEVNRDMNLSISDYDLVYAGERTAEKGSSIESELDNLYYVFNVDRPEDFRGHSLSVSDVIVLTDGAEKTAYYVQSIGFAEYPEFLNVADLNLTDKPEQDVIAEFKAKTAEQFHAINGATASKIEEDMAAYAQSVFDENGIDAKVVDVAVTGSRSRGLETEASDIDVVLEVQSDLKEDALFNILHEEPYDINGIPVDLNPIRAEETGTLANYLIESEIYLAEKQTQTAQSIAENQPELEKVTDDEATEIIETRERRGFFYTQNDNGTYTGIDNSNGEAWTEDFKTFEECKLWLLTGERLEENNEVNDTNDTQESVESTDTELDKLPISSVENGQVITYPDVQAMENAHEASSNSALEQAKTLINDFCEAEFNQKDDFSDLHNVSLAYTTLTDDELPIQVTADLIDFKITYEFDGEVFNTDQYDSIEDMVKNGLTGLDFDDLISVPYRILDAHTTANSIEDKLEDGESVVLTKGSKDYVLSLIDNKDIEWTSTLWLTESGTTGSDSVMLQKKVYDEDDLSSQILELLNDGYAYSEPAQNEAVASVYDEEDLTTEPSEPENITDQTPRLRATLNAFSEKYGLGELNIGTSNGSYYYPLTEKFQDGSELTLGTLHGSYDYPFTPESLETAFAEFEADLKRRNESVSEVRGRKEYAERHGGITELPPVVEGLPEIKYADNPSGKVSDNLEALSELHRLEQCKEAGRPLYDPKPKDYHSKENSDRRLRGYSGWGGVPQIFDESFSGMQYQRDRLKRLLTPEEYASARASTLNSHYTSQEIIDAMYKAVQEMGLSRDSRILEPACGTGNFITRMPHSIGNGGVVGVELDSTTAKIAQYLASNRENVTIKNCGFEVSHLDNDSFDLVIGNVPFGNYKMNDPDYVQDWLIHDAFFRKALDKVAVGGVVAFVTSSGTMDKKNPKIREYLATHADLIGAIRLPNTAFSDAGTNVTADIIFLQKREHPLTKSEPKPDWCYTVPFEMEKVGKPKDGEDPERVTSHINSYFARNPQMILGTMKQTTHFNMTTCEPVQGRTLADQLNDAVRNIHAKIAIAKNEKRIKQITGSIEPWGKDYAFQIQDDKVYYRRGEEMQEVQASRTTNLALIKELCPIRDLTRKLLEAQKTQASDEELMPLRKELNEAYDAFVAKYGHMNSKSVRSSFSDDSDYAILCALESESDGKITKADIFTKRTVNPQVEITSVSTLEEALQVSLDQRGTVNIPFMARLLSSDSNENLEDVRQRITAELVEKELIFHDPAKEASDNPYACFVDRAEYLSGNVRQKLVMAEFAVQTNPELQRNVDALKAVQPENITASEIDATIGCTWIDPKDYIEFLQHLSGRPYYSAKKIELDYSAVTGEFVFKNARSKADLNVAEVSTYGTSDLSLYALFEKMLNQRRIEVKRKDTDPYDPSREIIRTDAKATKIANEKAKLIKQEFKKWIFSDPERCKKYEEIYNRLFNSLVGRSYDGSHLTFKGMKSGFQLRQHQKDCVARTIYGGNTLVAHVVGAGKSAVIASSVMKKKELGLIHKACLVVPKPLTEQAERDWRKVYPDAKLLVVNNADLSDEKRREVFAARVATGDYDCIIMSQEQFEKLSMSKEYQLEYLRKQEDELLDRMEALKAQGIRNYSVKDTERELDKVRFRIAQLLDPKSASKSKDKILDFETLGFDYLVVDEAHAYKNGFVSTKMTNVAGVSVKASGRAQDMQMKCDYFNEHLGDGHILFATGTPVSNSMTELYVMSRYLRPDLLASAGVGRFDEWAATFGNITQQNKQTARGTLQLKTSFSSFKNTPELMTMYKEFADIRTADQLPELDVPKLETGKRQIITVDATPEQKQYVRELAERAKAIEQGNVDPRMDNLLKITSEARMVGLGNMSIAHLYAKNDRPIPDGLTTDRTKQTEKNSKVDACVEKVAELYKKTEAERGVQIIFSDIAVNSDNGSFSAYEYVKAELVAKGIPEEEIVFAPKSDAKNRQDIFRDINEGKYRVVIASTGTLGTGANIQQKLYALHHLDIPWKPSDFEQREGRILRQGNSYKTVEIFNYVTKGTLDSYLYQTVTDKARFIAQLWNDKCPARVMEDCDEKVLSYGELQAAAEDNPDLKIRIELKNKIGELKLLVTEYNRETAEMKKFIAEFPEQAERLKTLIQQGEHDIVSAAKLRSEEGKIEAITVRKENGTTLTQKSDINKYLLELLHKKKDSMNQKQESFAIGDFQISVQRSPRDWNTFVFAVKGERDTVYYCNANASNNSDNCQRLMNFFESQIESAVARDKQSLQDLNTNFELAQERVQKKFDGEDELAKAEEEFAQVEERLTNAGLLGEAVEYADAESSSNIPFDSNNSESNSNDEPDEDTPLSDMSI